MMRQIRIYFGRGYQAFLLLVFSVLVASFLARCGHYQFGQGNRAFPGGYDRVAIPMFLNGTQEVGIETYFTDSLRSEFERSRLAKVVSKSDAQVIIEGNISFLSLVPGVPINSDSTELTKPSGLAVDPAASPGAPIPTNPLPKGVILSKQYTANISVNIVARRVSDNTVLWEGAFTGSRNYLAPLIGDPRNGLNSVNAIYNQSSRQMTLAQLAKDMMSEAHDRLTENF